MCTGVWTGGGSRSSLRETLTGERNTDTDGDPVGGVVQ